MFIHRSTNIFMHKLCKLGWLICIMLEIIISFTNIVVAHSFSYKTIYGCICVNLMVYLKNIFFAKCVLFFKKGLRLFGTGMPKTLRLKRFNYCNNL